MDRSYCDNCNESCRPRTVTIAWESDRYCNDRQKEIRGLCEDCARAIAFLDFARLAERRAARPRTTTLP